MMLKLYLPFRNDGVCFMKDLIKNAVDDIKQDIDESVIDSKNERKRNPAKYIGNRSTPESYALTKLFVPHILGIFLGMAVAKLFNTGFGGYIFFGTVFSFLTGVWKSYELDNIRLKNAMVKNALITGFIALMIIIGVVYAHLVGT